LGSTALNTVGDCFRFTLINGTSLQADRLARVAPGHYWRVVGIGAAEFENADLMAGDISHINRVLLSVLRILRSNLEDKLLLLLRERIAWSIIASAMVVNSLTTCTSRSSHRS
jgi:hypothetical protein